MSDYPVVVGIDGSPVSRAALLWAARAADASQSALLVAVAGDVTKPAQIALGAPDPSGDLIDGALDALARADFQGEGRTLVFDQQPKPLLDELSVSAAMIVLGAGVEGRFASLLFGSVSAHVLAHGLCPVVTVPPEWIDHPSSGTPLVVIGVKPSAGGSEALEFGMSYAEATGSRVLAIRCWDRHESIDAANPLAERDIQHEVLDGLVTEASSRYPYVQVAKQVAPGPVHDALRLAALSADLLVIGTRSASGSRGSRLGPIAARLTRRMPCPVAVVSSPRMQVPTRDGTLGPVLGTPSARQLT